MCSWRGECSSSIAGCATWIVRAPRASSVLSLEANVDDQAQGMPDGAEPAEGAARAPYSPPALKVYGTIAALTRSVGSMGMVSDGGHGTKTKTS